MPRIAEDAGVSLATVYLYFPGRAAIVGALADELAAMPDLSVDNCASTRLGKAYFPLQLSSASRKAAATWIRFELARVCAAPRAG